MVSGSNPVVAHIYDDHWRLTWSLTSGPVKLVEVHASWPEHPR
jgi:hypothetical protein